jgi:hypothetical protein
MANYERFPIGRGADVDPRSAQDHKTTAHEHEDNSEDTEDGNDHNFQQALAAIYTALRPFPEAFAAIDRALAAELLGSTTRKLETPAEPEERSPTP